MAIAHISLTLSLPSDHETLTYVVSACKIIQVAPRRSHHTCFRFSDRRIEYDACDLYATHSTRFSCLPSSSSFRHVNQCISHCSSQHRSRSFIVEFARSEERSTRYKVDIRSNSCSRSSVKYWRQFRLSFFENVTLFSPLVINNSLSIAWTGPRSTTSCDDLSYGYSGARNRISSSRRSSRSIRYD